MFDTTTSIACVSGDSAILRSIQDEACSLAIWERAPLDGMDKLLEGTPRNIRLHTARQDLRPNIADALAANGFPEPTSHQGLIDDIVALADLYCAPLGMDELEVRLEVVTTDSCRRWHADYVTARLITTYVGDGTQWLEADEAGRVKDGFNAQRINQLQTGAVGIFKGRLATGHPAIHRSPPIAGTGQTRLLLVLNPIHEK